MTNISSEFLPLAGSEISTNDDPTLETISLTLFVSGCPRRCKGCQNSELQNVDLSNLVPITKVKELIISKMSLIKSIVFCGGDWYPWYESQLVSLVEFCKENNLKSILYTGENYSNINEWVKLNVDIIISEPYIDELKQDSFPASKNQKVWIDQVEVDPSKLRINN